MRRKHGTFMARSALVLLVAFEAVPAWGGSTVATPALPLPPGGRIRCAVSNASETETLAVQWGLYNYKGEAEWGPVVVDLEPLGNSINGNPVHTQCSCVARVLSGSRRSLRVSLTAETSAGNIQAAVDGR
jgi:hypothetical protein